MPTKRKSNKTTQNSNTFVSQDRFHINITTKSSTHGAAWLARRLLNKNAHCLLPVGAYYCQLPRPTAAAAAQSGSSGPSPTPAALAHGGSGDPRPHRGGSTQKQTASSHFTHTLTHLVAGAPSQHSMTQHKTEDEIYIYIYVYIYMYVYSSVYSICIYIKPSDGMHIHVTYTVLYTPPTKEAVHHVYTHAYMIM